MRWLHEDLARESEDNQVWLPLKTIDAALEGLTPTTSAWRWDRGRQVTPGGLPASCDGALTGSPALPQP